MYIAIQLLTTTYISTAISFSLNSRYIDARLNCIGHQKIYAEDICLNNEYLILFVEYPCEAQDGWVGLLQGDG